MKKIEAIIRESKLATVKKGLHEVGVNFFSYWSVNDVLHEGDAYLKTEEKDNTDVTQKCYLSILVNDDFEAVTIKAILDFANTGEKGDGRIFVTSINEVYKIETKEKGNKTLR